MAVKDDYKRNRKRVQQAIRRLKEQGYDIPEDALPPIPKRVTAASVRRLEKITPKKLREKYSFSVKAEKKKKENNAFNADEQVIRRYQSICESYFGSFYPYEQRNAQYLFGSIQNLVESYGVGAAADVILKTTNAVEFTQLIEESGDKGYEKVQDINYKWLSFVYQNGTYEEIIEAYEEDY